MHTGAKYTKCSRWWSFQSFPKFENKSLGREKQSWTYFEEIFWRILGWKTHPNPNPSEEWKFGWNLQSTTNAPLFLSAANTVIAPHTKAAGMSILQALRMAIPLWIAITAARDFLQLTGGWDSTHLSASISLQEILNISKACLLGQHNLWRHKNPACQSLWCLARCMTMYAYYMFGTCSYPFFPHLSW